VATCKYCSLKRYLMHNSIDDIHFLLNKLDCAQFKNPTTQK
jgi:hypothetical protein